MMKLRLVVGVLIASSYLSPHSASATDAVSEKYIKTPTGYLMVLRQGDNVFEHLRQLAKAEQIPSASVTGFGFVQARFGFWNAKQKIYEPRDIDDVEMASMNGSIAWKEGEPSLHMHGVVVDRDFHAYGGHLLDLMVSTGSVEITILLHDKHLERATDKNLGADVLGMQ